MKKIITILFQNVNLVRIWLNKAYNIYEKSNALDETISSGSDYELVGGENDTIIPTIFLYKAKSIPNQKIAGYTTSCTAQGTTEASNTVRKIKADRNANSGFILWDIMLKLGLGTKSKGAYVIDAIKQAKIEGFLSGYYKIGRTDFINNIRHAIYYNTSTVVSGTVKIDWDLLKTTNYILSLASSGYGHCFYIAGFDDINQRFICYNSYGKEYGDNGKFYIPYSLAEEVLFNSTYGIVVSAEWSTKTKEELFEEYKLTRTNANK